MKYFFIIVMFLSAQVLGAEAGNLNVGKLQIFSSAENIIGCQGKLSKGQLNGPVVVMRASNNFEHWCWVVAEDSLNPVYSLLLTAKSTGKPINILSSRGIGNYIEEITGVEIGN